MKSIIAAVLLVTLAGCFPTTGGKVEGIDHEIETTNKELTNLVGKDSVVIYMAGERMVLKAQDGKGTIKTEKEKD